MVSIGASQIARIRLEIPDVVRETAQSLYQHALPHLWNDVSDQDLPIDALPLSFIEKHLDGGHWWEEEEDTVPDAPGPILTSFVGYFAAVAMMQVVLVILRFSYFNVDSWTAGNRPCLSNGTRNNVGRVFIRRVASALGGRHLPQIRERRSFIHPPIGPRQHPKAGPRDADVSNEQSFISVKQSIWE
jgi:hypothetical protein